MERTWTPLEYYITKQLGNEDTMIALERIAKKAVAYSCNEYHKGKFISGCYYCQIRSATESHDELTQQNLDTALNFDKSVLTDDDE